MELSNFQKRILLVPEPYDLFLGGGRGGAKSYTLALLAMRHAEQYGNRARILYLRQTYAGLADFESITRVLFGQVYGRAARYNAGRHSWRLPGGAYMELAQLEGEDDYGKFQGRSFTLLLIDECGQYATPSLLDRLRSNMRGPPDIPLRVVMAANPGDPGHTWIAGRYVFRASPWAPFYEPTSKRQWVYAPSTFLDNPFIDQAAYRRQLEASAPSDPELLRAWLQGDWAIARGAFFGAVLSEGRNALDGDVLPAASVASADLFLAHDYGSTAPSVTYVMLRSEGFFGSGGRYYPNGSLLVLDELATYVPNNLNTGLQWTVPRLAEEIRILCRPYGMRPEGCADDAIFAQHGHSAGSIAAEFARAGVRFNPAHKADRKTGWETLRRMMQDAGKPDKPGLFVHRRCEYFWATVPYLTRDPKRQDDLDSRGPDHGADALRYGVLFARQPIQMHELSEFIT